MKITNQWANDMAGVLQRTAEGLLNKKEGVLNDIIKQQSMVKTTGITLEGIAEAIGAAGKSVATNTFSRTGMEKTAVKALSGVAAKGAMMGAVKAAGTAGTGTAISTLSGAAATNATLAWFGGGSMFIGGTFVLPALAIGITWLGWHFVVEGSTRKERDLTDQERAMFNRCLYFAALLRGKIKATKTTPQFTPKDVEALRVLKKDIGDYLHGCRKLSPVRKRAEKNLEEMSALLDKLG